MKHFFNYFKNNKFCIKKVILSIFCTMLCVLVVSCTAHQPDYKQFITNMYEQDLYIDYDFLEKHCSQTLLQKLSKEYDYDDQGYAVWKFRSSAQDGINDKKSIVSIVEEGDGWYRYTALDMGLTFVNRIKLSCSRDTIKIEDLTSANRLIAPRAADVDVDNMQDCIIAAAFTTDDFKWMGGNLTLTAFSRDVYDNVDLLRVGDTLLYGSKPIVIENIEYLPDGGYQINEGLENGGCCLGLIEDNTYVGREWDDHATYTKLGKAQLPLSEDFVIIDCGMDPFDPIDTIITGQKLYLENLKMSRREFWSLNTSVTIKNGMITEICRKWIP